MTRSDLNIAYELRQAGVSLEKIGKRFGVTKQAIHVALKSFDPNARSPACRDDEPWICMHGVNVTDAPRGAPACPDCDAATRKMLSDAKEISTLRARGYSFETALAMVREPA